MFGIAFCEAAALAANPDICMVALRSAVADKVEELQKRESL